MRSGRSTAAFACIGTTTTATPIAIGAAMAGIQRLEPSGRPGAVLGAHAFRLRRVATSVIDRRRTHRIRARDASTHCPRPGLRSTLRAFVAVVPSSGGSHGPRHSSLRIPRGEPHARRRACRRRRRRRCTGIRGRASRAAGPIDLDGIRRRRVIRRRRSQRGRPRGASQGRQRRRRRGGDGRGARRDRALQRRHRRRRVLRVLRRRDRRGHHDRRARDGARRHAERRASSSREVWTPITRSAWLAPSPTSCRRASRSASRARSPPGRRRSTGSAPSRCRRC